MAIVFFFTNDFLHFITAVLLYSLHICWSAQLLLTETQTQGRVNVKMPGWHTSYQLSLQRNELLNTWTRLHMSNRKLKSPNRKKGRRVSRLATLWLAVILEANSTVRNSTNVWVFFFIKSYAECVRNHIYSKKIRLYFQDSLMLHSCVQLQLWLVDDMSEGFLAVVWVNRRTFLAGSEVGGIMEQVDIDQVESSVRKTHTSKIRWYVTGGARKHKTIWHQHLILTSDKWACVWFCVCVPTRVSLSYL